MTLQAEIFCWKEKSDLNTELVLQFVQQKMILFYSMLDSLRKENLPVKLNGVS